MNRINDEVFDPDVNSLLQGSNLGWTRDCKLSRSHNKFRQKRRNIPRVRR